MDKNEILEKSRKENQLRDEGVLNARDKGRQWGVVGFLALCVLVMAYHLIRGLDNSLPMTFFLGYLSSRPLASTGSGGRRSFCFPASSAQWVPWPLWPPTFWRHGRGGGGHGQK